MKFKLSINGKVKYSKGEQAAFNALGAKAQTSTDLLKKLYPRSQPINCRKTLIGTLRSLQLKIVANREKFRLAKGKLSGPHAMEFWLEAK